MTRDIRNAAGAQGNLEFPALWAGQAAALAIEAPAAEIVATIAAEMRRSITNAAFCAK